MPSTEPEELSEEVRSIVDANTGLIDFTINRFGFDSSNGYTRADAWQDGYLGLIDAVRRWKPERGSLATIAVIYIFKAIRSGRGQFGGIDYRRSRRNGQRVEIPLSLDRPATGQTDTLADSLMADPDASPESEALRASLLATIAEVGHALCATDLERAVLEALLDFDDHRLPAAKHRTVAANFGVQAEHVRRVQHRLFARIRAALADTDLEAA